MIAGGTSSHRLLHPTGSETELFFVRHGQTSANVAQQLAGSTDVSLDDIGRYQASRVAERFRSIPIDAVMSSPLQRAHYTARHIGAVTGHEPILMAELQEIHFGDAEMLTHQEIHTRWPRLLEDQPDQARYDFRWPNGESDSELLTRVLGAIEAVAREIPEKRVAMVCHGGVIQRLLNHLNGGARADFLRYPITNCSITHLSLRSGETVIHSWNDHSHLNQVPDSLDLAINDLKEVAP
ncbi:MAG: histidine phosphatase family protein [Thermomicrobiales bacterium]|nr:histidine phosphatase family protein [Thermomicrobiales bacterium]